MLQPRIAEGNGLFAPNPEHFQRLREIRTLLIADWKCSLEKLPASFVDHASASALLDRAALYQRALAAVDSFLEYADWYIPSSNASDRGNADACFNVTHAEN